MEMPTLHGFGLAASSLDRCSFFFALLITHMIVPMSRKSHDKWQSNMSKMAIFVDLYVCSYDSSDFVSDNLVGINKESGCKAAH